MQCRAFIIQYKRLYLARCWTRVSVTVVYQTDPLAPFVFLLDSLMPARRTQTVAKSRSRHYRVGDRVGYLENDEYFVGIIVSAGKSKCPPHKRALKLEAPYDKGKV